jgi:hypothetical protein
LEKLAFLYISYNDIHFYENNNLVDDNKNMYINQYWKFNNILSLLILQCYFIFLNEIYEMVIRNIFYYKMSVLDFFTIQKMSQKMSKNRPKIDPFLRKFYRLNFSNVENNYD